MKKFRIPVFLLALPLLLGGCGGAGTSGENPPGSPGNSYPPPTVDYVAVAGSAEGIFVVDVSDPTNPKLARRLPVRYEDGGLVDVDSVLWVGGRIYANNGYNVFVASVENPEDPVPLGWIKLPIPSGKLSRKIAVSGNYAYIGDLDHDLIYIVNVRKIDDNYHIVAQPNVPVSPEIIRVRDRYAFVGALSDVIVLDVANPSNVRELAQVKFSSVEDVQVSGDYLYVLDGSDGLVVADVSDAGHPEMLGSLASVGRGNHLYLSGHYAFITSIYGDFWIVDVSEPTNPREVGHLELKRKMSGMDQPVYLTGVYVSGPYAYLGADVQGLYLVDISQPSEPRVVSRMDFGLKAYDVALSGDGRVAYVADSAYGIEVYDVTRHASPEFLERVETDGDAYGLFVSENRLYVAEQERVEVFDISEPQHPVKKGVWRAYQKIDSVWVQGSYAYAVGYSGLFVLDVSDPENPVQVSDYATESPAHDVQVVGSLAYIATDNGLVVVDVSNPERPTGVGRLSTSGESRALFVSGDRAYVGSGTELWVVDVSDPSEPARLRSCDLKGPIYDVAASGDVVYVSGGFFDAFYLLSGADCSEAARLDTPSWGGPLRFRLRGGTVFLADEDEGLVIADVSGSEPRLLADTTWFNALDLTGP